MTVTRHGLNGFYPALIFVCACGCELSEDISSRQLKCYKCSSVMSDDDRLQIELASQTFLEIAKKEGIEAIMYGLAEYDLDEAALPTGLLPIIITRAAQTSHLAYPNQPFKFFIGEIEDPDGLVTTTSYYIGVDRESSMDIKVALQILAHVCKKLIEISRLQNPSNTYIEDLSQITMSTLIEGYQAA